MRTKIYGHRGSKGTYPENTLLSFQKSIESGVDGLEIDIHMTKDGEIVIIHDETLERTTTGKGYIKDYTVKELKSVSTGKKFKKMKAYEKEWDNETIPTLKELFDLLAPTNIELNIELKTYIFQYPGIEEKLLEIVEEFGGKRKIVYSSFHLPTLIRLKNIKHDVKNAWLINQEIPHPGDYLETFELEALHVNKNLVLENQQYWKKYQEHLRVWTVNDKSEMKGLIEAGVDAIITDYPEVALDLYTKRT
ncbi:glycerophosphodiester phosphodiesterase [Saliterribacillus persicus]|uniref:Glycerophosphoryl diester phosphodiesterase n=1 Tax=Saliterribacillus persicus TaxID=930114 RepID=A0A368XRW5_9BACI|nr:glycerophosphodiester phosphodiesterase [Saliterribacillus persicus]RCW69788.1 glycerophosphoryl diester phosphodiesterase [Saliterribacillus persicus]